MNKKIIDLLEKLCSDGDIAEYELGAEDMVYLELGKDDEFMILDVSDEKSWFCVSISDEISLDETPKAAMYGALACNTLNTHYQEYPVAFSFMINDEEGAAASFTQVTSIPCPEAQSLEGLSEFVKSAICVKQQSAAAINTFIGHSIHDRLTLDDCFFNTNITFHPLLQKLLEEYSKSQTEED